MIPLDVFSYCMQIFIPVVLIWSLQRIFGNNSNDRLDRIENQLANIQVEITNVQTQMANVQTQMANIQLQIVAIQAQNTQQQNRIVGLEREMEALKETVREIMYLVQRR